MTQLIITSGIASDIHNGASGTAAPPAAGYSGGGPYRMLLEFDSATLAGIPANAHINSVSLALTDQSIYSDNGVSSWDVNLQRVIGSWLVDANSPSWVIRNYSAGFNWAVAGCSSNGVDRVAAISDTYHQVAPASAATHTLTGNGLVTDVKYWISDPSNLNWGWLITAPTAEAASSGACYSEIWDFTASQASKPSLTINYTLGGEGRLTHLW